MAKAKSKKGNKVTMIPVPSRHANAIKELVSDTLKELDAPEPKPIKRVVKISDKQITEVVELVKQLKPHVKALTKENFRLLDLFDHDLAAPDLTWANKQTDRIRGVIKLIEELMPDY